MKVLMMLLLMCNISYAATTMYIKDVERVGNNIQVSIVVSDGAFSKPYQILISEKEIENVSTWLEIRDNILKPKIQLIVAKFNKTSAVNSLLVSKVGQTFIIQ